MADLEKIECVVEVITFRNEDNGYSVLKCRKGKSKERITVVGCMTEPSLGSLIEFGGKWVMHPKFGMQFNFESFEEKLPTTPEGMKKYLAGKIKGIGETFAERIVEQFGKKTFDILDKKINKLLEVKGMTEKRLKLIQESWDSNREINKIMAFLQSYGATTALATKIYNYYGADSVKVLKENPYKLADEIWGVGFKTADIMAAKLGFTKENYDRIRCGILYTLNKMSDDGHCFSFIDVLIEKAAELLEIDKTLLTPVIKKMVYGKDIIQEEIFDAEADFGSKTAIYLPLYYYSELGTARKLVKLICGSRGYFDDLDDDDVSYIAPYGIRYAHEQIEAIKAAVKNKVLVLTGGPGTGKTTTTLGIISAYRQAGARVLLAAPTGRAAKRMSEVTKMTAKTIHRLLEARPPAGFGRNEDNPLEGDVLIVDECSMIDILLMNSLLKAIPENMTLILVGDVDQLPSVGAGKVLSDILESGVVPFVKLDKIFRQAQTSKIITNAHRINNDGFIELNYKNFDESDFVFLEEGEPEKAADLIVNLCSEILPEKYKINPVDIQVLSPMRRGVIGTAVLNARLQNALNPGNVSIRYGDTEFRVRDKVMQIRNNYEKGVFNGDIGFISQIDTNSGAISVIFDDENNVVYEREELDEIVLAYATTIHKSQGSEFPYVIIPMMMSHFIMLQRNLLYTGVTRAKKGLILVGEMRAVFYAKKNNKIQERNTDLITKLKNLFREAEDEY